ncbi:hypothetical protein BDP27DRAFT_1365164 [Rhodocollybia butyracea]|uniref:Uncharacterized protein n=1 Tax=Rhodocollybia butyracea TaxID=206335 RepID=A0A9P5PK46_9AGAR|nr:hypothetical protein BDP27DRAFT_1365164 [Rhodocollybia butyracea]
MLLFDFVFTLASFSLWSLERVGANLKPNVPNCNETTTIWLIGWSLNSLNQSPCQVAGFLAAACVELMEVVTVAMNCTETSTAYYPLPVPPETAIPHWAFQDYSIILSFGFSKFNNCIRYTYHLQCSSKSESSSSGSKIKPGAISGIVAGSLALLFMVGIGIGFRWLWRRRLAEQYQVGLNPEWSLYDVAAKHQITSTKQAELQQEREELAQRIYDLQTSQLEMQMEQPSGNGSTGIAGELLQTRMLEMEARMERLTSELSRHIEPPAYENGMA